MRTTRNFKATQITNLIRDEASGVYYVRFRVEQPGGGSRQILRSLRTDDLAAAKMTYAAAIASARNEPPPVNSRLLDTVGDAIETLRRNGWHVNRRATKPRTSAYYEERMAAVVRSWPSLPETLLLKITPDIARDWWDRFAPTISGHAANMSLALLRRAFDLAKDRGRATSNPFEKLVREKVTVEKIVTVPSREKFEELLRVLDARVHHNARAVNDLIRLMAFSGLRIGEARGLKWGSVDFTTGVVRVEWQLDGGGNFVRPKTWRADRQQVVDMSPQLREHLLSMHNRAGSPPDDARVITVDSCDGALAFACRVANVPRLTAHGLRHLFATRSLENGIPANVVAEWLGHKDGGVLVSKTYGHVIREQARRMAALNSFAPSPEPQNVTPMPGEAVGVASC